MALGSDKSVIEIHEPCNAWAEDFDAQAAQIREALGPLAVRVDHIGSTSVPGLAAKDVIDIQVTVAEFSTEVIRRMSNAGFVHYNSIGQDHVPPGQDPDFEHWSKLLFLEKSGERRCNIHVRQVGRANQRYALLFRDYLRTHPDTAAAYAELKRRLAVSLSDSRMYPNVKDPAVDLIFLAAEEWALHSGWSP